MRLIAIAAFAILLPQETHEAEELFRKMEEKFTKANSFQLSWKVAATIKEGELTAEGTVLLSEGNKARIDFAAKVLDQDQKDQFISDGKTLETYGSRSSSVATPETFNKTVLGSIARGGAVQALTVINMKYYTRESDPRKLFTLSSFAMGKKEKVEKREAQVIEFKATLNPNKQEATVKLWIDCESGLPLKRVFTVNEMKQEIVSTETYSNIKFDEKIDSSKFEFPK